MGKINQYNFKSCCKTDSPTSDNESKSAISGYLAAPLLLERPGDERRVPLDDGHVLYPPALRQLGVRRDLNELQAHLLPQSSGQAPELTLAFG